MCLTVFVTSAGNRGAAARQYHIDIDVLNKLGELTSTKGSAADARKAPGNRTFNPLSPQETAWIEAVVKSLIRRVGEYDYNPNAPLKRISMNDFPSM